MAHVCWPETWPVALRVWSSCEVKVDGMVSQNSGYLETWTWGV